MLTDAQRQFLAARPVARFASADARATPHVIPVCFAIEGENAYFSIDAKPKRPGAYSLKRIRNIKENPKVMLMADRYDDDWRRLAWVMLHGEAEILDHGTEHDHAQALLRERYPQYLSMDLAPLPVVAIRIRRVTSWGSLGA
jgi:PPOX class probable F420-dependent enzyme